MFSIVICRQLGNKWQSKTFSNDFLSRFVDGINVFDYHLPSVLHMRVNHAPVAIFNAAYVYLNASGENSTFREKIILNL